MPSAEYRCPGEPYPISRAIHLGRLAAFYPGCRQCCHRDDTGTLSPRHVERLVESRARGLSGPLFHDEGAGGEYLNDLGPATARDMAAALGVSLRRRLGAHKRPVVAVADDGRPMGRRMLAAVGEGLRWAGCHLVDVGSTSAACLAFAVDHLQTDGGVLVGNPGDRPQCVGLKFWSPGPQPLSAGGSLEPIEQTHQQGVDRPDRTYGTLRRFRADVPYLDALVEHYHALRPLRIVLDTSCGPVVRYVEKLIERVACRTVSEAAHLSVRIGDDGETAKLLDEQGRPVHALRTLLLVARHLRPAVVVLEDATGASHVEAFRTAGCRVELSGPRRAEMAAAMRQHGATLGGGPTGRFWYAATGPPLPDALMTLTLLLVILSRSDRRLSEVLDREAALV